MHLNRIGEFNNDKGNGYRQEKGVAGCRSCFYLGGFVDKLKLKLTVNSVKYVFQELTKLLRNQKEYEIVVSEWSEKRTLSANAQQHVWYKQIAEFYGVTIKEAGNMSKRDFGLPILLGDEKYAKRINFVLDKIGYWDLNLEQQANVMDLIQVTSLFSTKQHNMYRDNMQRHWQQLGLELEYK